MKNNTKNDAFLYARDMFFVEFLTNTKNNKNRQLYNLLVKESKNSGFLPFTIYSLISDIFFKKINQSNEKENKRVLFFKKGFTKEIINKSIDFSDKNYLISLQKSFQELIKNSEYTLNEKLNLKLLINDISKLNKKNFLETLFDYFNKEWFYKSPFNFKKQKPDLEKIKNEKLNDDSYKDLLTNKNFFPVYNILENNV